MRFFLQYHTFYNSTGETWFAKKAPIDDKIIAIVQKISARNQHQPLQNSEIESRDPDATTLPTTLDFSKPLPRSKENSKPNKRQCEIVAHFRHVEIKDLYFKSLVKYEINQEAKQDFLKMMKQVESEKWRFSKAMGTFYLLDQVGVTTFNLTRNLIELYNTFSPIEAKFLSELNKRIDNWQKSIREGDVESLSTQEVAFDATCKQLLNRSSLLGKSAITICSAVNDIKYLTQIQNKNDKVREELYASYLKLEYQLNIYEQSLQSEMQNQTGIRDLIQTLDNYLISNCKH